MAQNTSHAVMQQRTEARDGLEDFPTPPWAGRALAHLLFGPPAKKGVCREPAANRGYLVRALEPWFAHVDAADIHDYGAGYEVGDYLDRNRRILPVDWTITNPPFNRFVPFAHRALDTSLSGVALFARSAILEGQERHRSLFSVLPPTDIYQFVERVPIVRGRVSVKASTASCYCWLVWRMDDWTDHPRLHWIPPVRRDLERAEDYPDSA